MSKPCFPSRPSFGRAVTLLETLVALAIVIAAGGLIFPMMMNGLDERAFESVADVTNEQLMLARAHAQSTGSPVEVTFNHATSRVEARLYAPWSFAEAISSNASQWPSPQMGSGEPETATFVERLPESSDRNIAESWACQQLGSNLRFRTSPPGDDVADGNRNLAEPMLGEDDFESLADLASGQEVRLAVFMPDGSALAGDPVWLDDHQGRCGLFTINPWSGLPLFQRMNQSPSTADSADRERDVAPMTGEDDAAPSNSDSRWSADQSSGDDDQAGEFDRQDEPLDF